MEKVKQFNNTKDLNNYLKYEAKEGEVVELNEVADWTHPKRITRFVKWLTMVTDEDILKIENRIYKKLREQGSFAIIDDGTAEKELSRLLLNYHKDRIWLLNALWKIKKDYVKRKLERI